MSKRHIPVQVLNPFHPCQPLDPSSLEGLKVVRIKLLVMHSVHLLNLLCSFSLWTPFTDADDWTIPTWQCCKCCSSSCLWRILDTSSSSRKRRSFSCSVLNTFHPCLQRNFSYLVVLQLLQLQLFVVHSVHILYLLWQVLLLLLQCLYLYTTHAAAGEHQQKNPP